MMRHLIQTVGAAVVINENILQSAVNMLVRALRHYLSWAIHDPEEDVVTPRKIFYCNWDSHEYYSAMKYASISDMIISLNYY